MDFYWQTFLKTIPSHCQFWRTWMLFLTPFWTKTVLVTKMWCSHMVQIWDPMLGLIIDVRAPQATFPAAALSRVWVLRFVYLVFPIRLYNNHKYCSPPSTKTSRDEQLLLGACILPWYLTFLWCEPAFSVVNAALALKVVCPMFPGRFLHLSSESSNGLAGSFLNWKFCLYIPFVLGRDVEVQGCIQLEGFFYISSSTFKLLAHFQSNWQSCWAAHAGSWQNN